MSNFQNYQLSDQSVRIDPALLELAEAVNEDEIVEVILRLNDPNKIPSGVNVVSQFGEIVTCRVIAGKIMEIHDSKEVFSMKAPRFFNWEPPVDSFEETNVESVHTSTEDSYRITRNYTGLGSLVAVCDWGIDFTHPNFRLENGETRFLAFWDQTIDNGSKRINPYGYGSIYLQEDINWALQQDNPFLSLNYHPSKGGPPGVPAHGTHVLDIAAGNGRVGKIGIAPGAKLAAVHLGTGITKQIRNNFLNNDQLQRSFKLNDRISNPAKPMPVTDVNLGDSSRLLEAIDFVSKIAAKNNLTPCINLSVGSMAGPHTGTTLVELGMDEFLKAIPGRIICQSAGNYRQSQTHAEGCLRPGKNRPLTWIIDKADVTPNELEVWYSGRDVFSVDIEFPNGYRTEKIFIGKLKSIRYNGVEVGRIYHRYQDRNNLDNNHIDIFLYTNAPAGKWIVTIYGEDVIDGRYDAWIERDRGNPKNQSKLDEADFIYRSTIGTIANGERSIVVGAFDSHSIKKTLAPFSSCGPTRKGLQKPDILAPGVRIKAACSDLGLEFAQPLTVEKSGTSMASPFVTGTAALVYEAAGKRLSISEIRNIILGSADDSNIEIECSGSGYLNIDRAIETARKFSLEKIETDNKDISESQIEALENSDVSHFQNNSIRFLGGDEMIEMKKYEKDEKNRDLENEEKLIERIVLANIFNPMKIFRAFRSNNVDELISGLFEVIGMPGKKLKKTIRKGDILVRIPIGESSNGYIAIIVSSNLINYEELNKIGLTPESRRLGKYAQIIDGGVRPHAINDSFARLLIDFSARVPNNQMILRLNENDNFSELMNRDKNYGELTEDIEIFDETEQNEFEKKKMKFKNISANDATWAKDTISADYRHINQAGSSIPFSFTADNLESLCKLNDFDVDAGQDELLFGLRGCSIIQGNNGEFTDSVVLTEDVPDHFDYHCVIGVWKRSKRKLAVFKGSTVPNWYYMAKYKLSLQAANLIPTGCYVYKVGTHRANSDNPTDGVFLLNQKIIVRRTKNNLIYENTDIYEAVNPADNIHPGFNNAYATFSSAGCQTIPGSFDRKGPRAQWKHRGEFAKFRERAGLDPANNNDKVSEKFLYVLLTGREARLASSMKNKDLLKRLRFGSKGANVKSLQLALKLKVIDGEMGVDTTQKYMEWQKGIENGVSDGIVTPFISREFGFDIVGLKSITPVFSNVDNVDNQNSSSTLKNEETGIRKGINSLVLISVEEPGGGRIKDKTPADESKLTGVIGYSKSILLHPYAARALTEMISKARKDNINNPLLLPQSGYRSPKTQMRLWLRAVKKYGEKAARKYVAFPGNSAHQTGRAVDLYLGGQNSSANIDYLRKSTAYNWLTKNSEEFGFYPYPFEPWHWEYNPPALTVSKFERDENYSLVKPIESTPPTSSKAWPKLDRKIVITRLLELKKDANKFDQGAIGLCTAAAFYHHIIQKEPELFYTFAFYLYELGKSYLGKLEVKPSSDLRNRDYNSLLKKYPDMPPQADWMLMSALRDSENWIFDFEGSPTEDFAIRTSAKEMSKWYTKTGFYSNVEFSSDNSLNSIRNIGKHSRNHIALWIHVKLLGDPRNSTHIITLESPINIDEKNNKIEFKYWTWKEPNYKIMITTIENFKSNFKGKIIAEF